VKLVGNPVLLSYMLPGHLLLVGSLAKFYADADTEFSSIPPYTFTIRVALLVIKPLVRYRTDGADGHFVGGIRATTNNLLFAVFVVAPPPVIPYSVEFGHNDLRLM
jgi:hypothetical protein